MDGFEMVDAAGNEYVLAVTREAIEKEWSIDDIREDPSRLHRVEYDPGPIRAALSDGTPCELVSATEVIAHCKGGDIRLTPKI